MASTGGISLAGKGLGGAPNGRALGPSVRSRWRSAALQASAREPPSPTGGHVVSRSARLDAAQVVLCVPAANGGAVASVDQQPLRPLPVRTRTFAPKAGRLHEHERADKLLSVELELELARFDRSGWVGCRGVGPIGAQSQTMTSPAPYSCAGMTPSKASQRMVFDPHGEPALARIEGRPARDRPRYERAVDLEPEVVVKPRRPVALDDEASGHGGRAAGRS